MGSSWPEPALRVISVLTQRCLRLDVTPDATSPGWPRLRETRFSPGTACHAPGHRGQLRAGCGSSLCLWDSPPGHTLTQLPAPGGHLPAGAPGQDSGALPSPSRDGTGRGYQLPSRLLWLSCPHTPSPRGLRPRPQPSPMAQSVLCCAVSPAGRGWVWEPRAHSCDWTLPTAASRDVPGLLALAPWNPRPLLLVLTFWSHFCFYWLDRNWEEGVGL